MNGAGGTAAEKTAEENRKGDMPEFLIDHTFDKNINREIARVVARAYYGSLSPNSARRGFWPMVLLQGDKKQIKDDLLTSVMISAVVIEQASVDDNDTADNFHRYDATVRNTGQIGIGAIVLPAIILPVFLSLKEGGERRGVWYSGIVEGKENVEEFLVFLLEELAKLREKS